MSLKFGKKPARPDAVTLKFADVFNTVELPSPPRIFGHEAQIHSANWSMFGNDQYGDCVWAGAAHEHMLWTVAGKTSTARFTEQNVLSDYTAVTGFNPSDANSDQGTDMQQAAAYRQKTGIIDASGNRHKVDAYAALKAGDLNQLALATWLFGAVGVGVNCPNSMEDQFNHGRPWSVVKNDRIDGGHYIPCVGRNSVGNYVFVTWGRLQAATPSWVATYMDEGIAYLGLEFISTTDKISPEGFNQAALTSYLKALK